MGADQIYYFTGEEIHAGDRVQHKGSYGRIVFINTGASEEFSPGYEDHSGSEPGMVFCDDDGETSFLYEPDDLLSFIDRG